MLTVNPHSSESFTQIVSTQPSFLSWTDLFEENIEVVVRYGIAPSAYEASSDLKLVKNNVNVIEYVDVGLIESGKQSEFLETGAVINRSTSRDPNGMAHLTVDAFELEPAIMRVGDGFLEGDYVSSFYPRGFVEDLAIMNDIVYDSSLGQIIVEHGLLQTEDSEDIEVQLFNDLGETVGEAKYIDQSPALKAIFYDIPEGRFLVVIKDSTGAWLSSSIVHVFQSRLSIVRSGRQHVLNQTFCDVECLTD